MKTASEVSEAIRRALVKRQWKRAISILEQGIYTLHELPPEIPDDPFDDPTPCASIGLNVRILRALENFSGIVTVGQLRRLIADGKLRAVPDLGIAAEAVVQERLVSYRPRRNIFHGDRSNHR